MSEYENTQQKRFFALLDCEDAEKWANHPTLIWFPGLKARAEDWKWYKVFNGELPTDEELQLIKGLIITGSHHSVNQNDQWIENLFDFIRRFDRMTKEKQFKHNDPPKLYGACFGCQAIAKALGGVVNDNLTNKFEFSIEDIDVSPDITNYFPEMISNEIVDTLKKKNGKIRAVESHSECVVVAPPDAITLGKSNSSPNEIFLVNDNILAVQSHPELSPEIVLEKILPSLKSSGKLEIPTNYSSSMSCLAQEIFHENIDDEERIQSYFLKSDNDHSSFLSFVRSFLYN